MIVPSVGADEAIRQSGETLEELQAIVDLLANLEEMSPAMAALRLTLKTGKFELMPVIVSAFVNYAEVVKYKAELVDKWAIKALKLLANSKAHTEAQSSTTWRVSPPSGKRLGPTPHNPITQKERMGPFSPTQAKKKLCNDSRDSEQRRENEEMLLPERSPPPTALNFVEATTPCSRWSWKKAARLRLLTEHTHGDGGVGVMLGVMWAEENSKSNVVGFAGQPHHEK